jgi:hypothetical protein
MELCSLVGDIYIYIHIILPRGYGTVYSGRWCQGVMEPCILVGDIYIYIILPRGYGTVYSGR